MKEKKLPKMRYLYTEVPAQAEELLAGVAVGRKNIREGREFVQTLKDWRKRYLIQMLVAFAAVLLVFAALLLVFIFGADFLVAVGAAAGMAIAAGFVVLFVLPLLWLLRNFGGFFCANAMAQTLQKGLDTLSGEPDTTPK